MSKKKGEKYLLAKNIENDLSYILIKRINFFSLININFHCFFFYSKLLPYPNNIIHNRLLETEPKWHTDKE